MSAFFLRRNILHFNPLPPHGGRLHFCYGRHYLVYFNPLPPHGGRLCHSRSPPDWNYFNPLPPHGGRPVTPRNQESYRRFQSTPSTRRETWSVTKKYTYFQHFNPLPPHGGRPQCKSRVQTNPHFNPLPPHGGRLLDDALEEKKEEISIHSLHTEGDATAISSSI